MVFSWNKQSQQRSSSSGHGLGFSGMMLDSQCPLFQILMHIPSHRKKKNPFIPSVFPLFYLYPGLSLSQCMWDGNFDMETLGWKSWDGNFCPQVPRRCPGLPEERGFYSIPEAASSPLKEHPGKRALGWGNCRTCDLLLCPPSLVSRKGLQVSFAPSNGRKNPIPSCDFHVGRGISAQCSPRSAHLGLDRASISGCQTYAKARGNCSYQIYENEEKNKKKIHR